MRKILLSESTKKHVLLSGPLRRTHKARPFPSYKPKVERAARKQIEAAGRLHPKGKRKNAESRLAYESKKGNRQDRCPAFSKACAKKSFKRLSTLVSEVPGSKSMAHKLAFS